MAEIPKVGLEGMGEDGEDEIPSGYWHDAELREVNERARSGWALVAEYLLIAVLVAIVAIVVVVMVGKVGHVPNQVFFNLPAGTN